MRGGASAAIRCGATASATAFHRSEERTRFRVISPPSHTTTISEEIGLTGPMASCGGSSGPSSASDARMMTSSASMIGSRHLRQRSERRLAARDEIEEDQHGRLDRDPPEQVAGHDAEVAPDRRRHFVIATSGRVPAIPSRISPPIASPRWNRSSTTSVLSARIQPGAPGDTGRDQETTTNAGTPGRSRRRALSPGPPPTCGRSGCVRRCGRRRPLGARARTIASRHPVDAQLRDVWTWPLVSPLRQSSRRERDQ